METSYCLLVSLINFSIDEKMSFALLNKRLVKLFILLPEKSKHTRAGNRPLQVCVHNYQTDKTSNRLSASHVG